MRNWALIPLATLLIGAAPAETPASVGLMPNVSLISLIANPLAHDGKHVSVEGYLVYGHGATLYIDRDAFDHGLDQNAVKVDAYPEFYDGGRRARGYARVIGTFEAGQPGEPVFLPTILNVVSIKPLVSQQEFERQFQEPILERALALLGVGGTLMLGFLVWWRRHYRPNPRRNDARGKK